MIDLADYPLWLIFIVSMVAVVGAAAAGRALAVRAAGADSAQDFSMLQAAAMGLLSLMIGFTFSMALSRADARRVAVLEEANAIGTTALRARLLPSPHDADSLKLLREYVQIRLDLAQRPPSPAETRTAIDRSNAIQEALWQQVKAVAATDRTMVPTGLYMQTLNDMIDDHERRLVAAFNHLPSAVMVMLYGLAIFASGISGYASNRERETRRSALPVYIMGVVITAVILLVQDIDRPTSGLVTLNQQPIIDVAASLASHND
jgi:uncharacterized membrane protein